MEAQNKNLAAELERLKNKWGQETSQVKAMYQLELDEARKLLDDAVGDKGRLEIKVASLEDVLQELRSRFVARLQLSTLKLFTKLKLKIKNCCSMISRKGIYCIIRYYHLHYFIFLKQYFNSIRKLKLQTLINL